MNDLLHWIPARIKVDPDGCVYLTEGFMFTLNSRLDKLQEEIEELKELVLALAASK
jgi:hypothetical protein